MIPPSEKGEKMRGEYVDIDSIRKSNGFIYYNTLSNSYFNYKKNAESGIGSTTNKYKVDCSEEKLTWLSFSIYTGLWGKGKLKIKLTPNETSYPERFDNDHTLMQYVCNLVN